jgi:serine/threonine protein kinase
MSAAQASGNDPDPQLTTPQRRPPPVPEDDASAATLPLATVAAGPDASEVFPVPPPPEPAGPALPRLPTVPGYEILGELGRGGMGVVYMARQLRLKRVVALKMILAGLHAGVDAVARFRTEAEAVARLQHPHFVQIYEVGEADGRPYCALEYVDGGSLATRLAGTPLTPHQAARLIETLAMAMQAAHERGIVHRDLKPANVLLTRDGQPKITDFGLAKQLDTVQGQTRSGAIVGTPSYMAPEQAGGQSKEVGPAADIYALGAILYEMLTGRPPFQAATALDAVRRVLGEEPVPPSRVNVLLPRDLETICLKCLQKEPQRRYASAAALADDLRRFQTGEPILARPVGRWEQLRRWCRHNPALAALVGLSAVSVLLLAVQVGTSWRAASITLGTSAPEVQPAPLHTPAEPVQIQSLRIRSFRGPNSLGPLGTVVRATQFEDEVSVHAKLSGPAYCYLIAFNPAPFQPDRWEQLCFPEDAAVPPQPITALDYPADSETYFPLSDGVGLQAFVLVASRTPLPAYRDWRAATGPAPWRQVVADGVWRFDGQRLEQIDAERGAPRHRQGAPQPVLELGTFFKKCPQVDAVQVIAFPVQPQEAVLRVLGVSTTGLLIAPLAQGPFVAGAALFPQRATWGKQPPTQEPGK